MKDEYFTDGFYLSNVSEIELCVDKNVENYDNKIRQTLRKFGKVKVLKITQDEVDEEDLFKGLDDQEAELIEIFSLVGTSGIDQRKFLRNFKNVQKMIFIDSIGKKFSTNFSDFEKLKQFEWHDKSSVEWKNFDNHDWS